MITIETLKIFKKYNGQIDDWSKSKKEFDLEFMNAEKWYLISNYIQDIQLINSGIASKDFIKRFEESIKLHIKNSETFELLLKLSKVKPNGDTFAIFR